MIALMMESKCNKSVKNTQSVEGTKTQETAERYVSIQRGLKVTLRCSMTCEMDVYYIE